MGTPLSHLTLNVHGKLTHGIASCTEIYVNLNKTVSSVSVNIWGNVPKEEKNIFQGILDKNPAVTLNVPDVHLHSHESSDDPDVYVDDLTSLPTLVSQLRNTRQEKLIVAIFCKDLMTDFWHLSGAVMENTSFNANALTLIVDGFEANNFSEHSLLYGLEKTTLNELTLKINDYNSSGDFLLHSLVERFRKNRSLNALTVIVNKYSKGGRVSEAEDFILARDLVNTSLNAFTVTVNSYGTFSSGRMLAFFFSTPLSSLTLTISIYSDISDGWERGLGNVLAKNKS